VRSGVELIGRGGQFTAALHSAPIFTLRTFARRSEPLHRSGVCWTVALVEHLGRGGSAGGRFADAVEALAGCGLQASLHRYY
jgi:hypothetical protein